MTTELIPEYATPRKCRVCLDTATHYVYKKDQLEKKLDKSSWEPRCKRHAEETK